MQFGRNLITSAFLGSLGLVFISVPTLAADLLPQTKSPFNWTGFYIGANLGGAFGHTQSTAATPAAGLPSSRNVSGGLFGGFIGYNYQIQNFVIGGEADADWMWYRGRNICPNPLFTCSTSANAFASIRGRVGFALDRALLFSTAGIGFGSFTYRSYNTVLGPGSRTPYNVTAVGYALGGGLEYAFTDNWIARSEYLYYGFGNNTDNGQLDGAGKPRTVKTNANVFRIGAAYKF